MILRVSLCAALLLSASCAEAALFTVGARGCTHPTLDSALLAARANPGADNIHLVRWTAFGGVGVVIEDPDTVSIEGGYDKCNSATPSGSTRLDGTGVGRSVIHQRDGELVLRNLELVGGAPFDGLGGGLRVDGASRALHIENVLLSNNSATSGGGAYIDGSAGAGPTTVTATALRVEGNRAKYGGGLLLRGVSASIEGLQVRFNRAWRDGGGVHLDAAAGLWVLGSASGSAISGNVAGNDGGGAWVRNSTLWLAGSDSTAPASSISENSAAGHGGGAFVAAEDAGSTAIVVSQAVDWQGNSAQVGGAFSVHADSPIGVPPARAFAHVNDGGWTEHQPCVPAARCDIVRRNVARLPDGQPGIGAVGEIRALRGAAATATFGASTVRENFGSTLFHIDGPVGTSSAATTLMFHGALIHDNDSSGPLASATGSGHIVVTGSTLSANRTGPDLFVFDYAVSLTASIVFEDAQRIGNPAEGVYARDVLLRDASGLSPIVGLVLADPKFVDAANGNFRLKPDSPALDRTILLPPGWPERDNRPRSTDLPGIGIPGMPQDLGCFERQIGD